MVILFEVVSWWVNQLDGLPLMVKTREDTTQFAGLQFWRKAGGRTREQNRVPGQNGREGKRRSWEKMVSNPVDRRGIYGGVRTLSRYGQLHFSHSDINHHECEIGSAWHTESES